MFSLFYFLHFSFPFLISFRELWIFPFVPLKKWTKRLVMRIFYAEKIILEPNGWSQSRRRRKHKAQENKEKS